MDAGIWLCLHALSTVFMAGVIWFVQIVHYPLFARVPAGVYTEYQDEHMRRTSWVVGPAMLLEALSALMLVFVATSDVRRGASVGLLLLALIWAVTFAVMVPLHHKLAKGFDAGVIRRLVLVNWARTSLWSIRAVLALWMLLQVENIAGLSVRMLH